MGVVTPSSSDYNSAQRRSQRVMLKAPVVILTQGDDNKMVWEETRTVTVNVHGAMIVSRLRLLVGQLLTLRNSRTGEEAPSRVVYLSPRQTDNREVGIEFIEPRPKFWRISFPPSDWSARSPEAKGNTNRYSRTPTTKKI